MSEDDGLDRSQLQSLLDAGRELVIARDPEAVLRRVLDAGRELTGARYAALGILDSDKRELERFIFVGVDEELHRRIGSLPRGHGILGELIRHPEPLRLARISDHPRSYGFPAGHPPMQTFLGVPVMIRGEVYGNLYLAEKADGALFDERDERHVVVLADWAAVAIDNARSHVSLERRRLELERAMRGLQATVALSLDLGDEPDLERVLELVVKRARALVDGQSCFVLLAEDAGLRIAAGAGESSAELIGRMVIARDDGTLQRMLARAGERLDDDSTQSLLREGIGIDSEVLLTVPLRSRGRALGFLAVVDTIGDQPVFSADDELALASFATSAATVIAAARTAEGERLRLTIASAEQERRRWARELHDETLQDLGALRVLQQSALQLGDEDSARNALGEASDRIEEIIEGLRSLITDLRPPALDQLGIGAAVEALADRVRSRSDLQVETVIELGADRNDVSARFDPEIEVTVYRLVQEALTNVVKHAGATRALVMVEADESSLRVVVEDDGRGLDFEPRLGGFGLIGMRERVELADGELRLGPGDTGGTRIWAMLPTVFTS